MLARSEAHRIRERKTTEEHFFPLVCTKAGDNVETVTAHVVGASTPATADRTKNSFITFIVILHFLDFMRVELSGRAEVVITRSA